MNVFGLSFVLNETFLSTEGRALTVRRNCKCSFYFVISDENEKQDDDTAPAEEAAAEEGGAASGSAAGK